MSSSKKFSYSQDFKIKVLEYYFKHGGEAKFGLKSKTAQHFSIDKKTISRMLCNPDMVKKASKSLAQRTPATPNNLRASSKPGSKLSKPSSSSGSSKSDSGSSTKSPLIGSLSDPRPVEKKISVLDLPEDPDYSLLKRMIHSSASGAANVARLLVTATKEVQKMILNECDLIFECKVCKNLFRSVVNFLAHKRIYCQDEFVNVRTVFSENNPLGMTSESNTMVVDPEPPPCTPPPLYEEEPEGQSKIDKIAERLASRNLRKRKLEEMSSATHTGSSEYFERLQGVHCTRSQVSKNCSIMLKDIDTNPTAVYQTFVPPDQEIPDKSIDNFLQEVQQKKLGMTAFINSQGKVVDSQMGEPSSLDSRILDKEEQDIEESSQASSDCISAQSEGSLDTGQPVDVERLVYTCPICNITFLSVSGCVKHLYKVHKKKKHQRDRLRQVIRSRAYKKLFTQEEMKTHHNRVIEIKEAPAIVGKKSEREKRPRLVEKAKVKEEKAKISESTDTKVPIQCREGTRKLHARERWKCNVCNKKFLTRPASLAHIATHLICDFEPKVLRVEEDEESAVLNTKFTGREAQQSISGAILSRKSSNAPKKLGVTLSPHDDDDDEEYAKLIEESFAASNEKPLKEKESLEKEKRVYPKCSRKIAQPSTSQSHDGVTHSDKNASSNFWKSEANDNPLSITLKKFPKLTSSGLLPTDTIPIKRPPHEESTSKSQTDALLAKTDLTTEDTEGRSSNNSLLNLSHEPVGATQQTNFPDRNHSDESSACDTKANMSDVTLSKHPLCELKKDDTLYSNVNLTIETSDLLDRVNKIYQRNISFVKQKTSNGKNSQVSTITCTKDEHSNISFPPCEFNSNNSPPEISGTGTSDSPKNAPKRDAISNMQKDISNSEDSPLPSTAAKKAFDFEKKSLDDISVLEVRMPSKKLVKEDCCGYLREKKYEELFNSKSAYTRGSKRPKEKVQNPLTESGGSNSSKTDGLHLSSASTENLIDRVSVSSEVNIQEEECKFQPPEALSSTPSDFTASKEIKVELNPGNEIEKEENDIGNAFFVKDTTAAEEVHANSFSNFTVKVEDCGDPLTNEVKVETMGSPSSKNAVKVEDISDKDVIKEENKEDELVQSSVKVEGATDDGDTKKMINKDILDAEEMTILSINPCNKIVVDETKPIDPVECPNKKSPEVLRKSIHCESISTSAVIIPQKLKISSKSQECSLNKPLDETLTQPNDKLQQSNDSKRVQQNPTIDSLVKDSDKSQIGNSECPEKNSTMHTLKDSTGVVTSLLSASQSHLIGKSNSNLNPDGEVVHLEKSSHIEKNLSSPPAGLKDNRQIIGILPLFPQSIPLISSSKTKSAQEEKVPQGTIKDKSCTEDSPPLSAAKDQNSGRDRLYQISLSDICNRTKFGQKESALNEDVPKSFTLRNLISTRNVTPFHNNFQKTRDSKKGTSLHNLDSKNVHVKERVLNTKQTNPFQPKISEKFNNKGYSLTRFESREVHDKSVVLQSVKKLKKEECTSKCFPRSLSESTSFETSSHSPQTSKEPKKSFWETMKFPKITAKKASLKTKTAAPDNGRKEVHSMSDGGLPFPLVSTYDAKSKKRRSSLDLSNAPKTLKPSETPSKEAARQKTTDSDLSHFYSLPSTSKGFPSMRQVSSKPPPFDGSSNDPKPHSSKRSDHSSIDCLADALTPAKEDPSIEGSPQSVTIDEDELMSQGLSFGDVRYGWELL